MLAGAADGRPPTQRPPAPTWPPLLLLLQDTMKFSLSTSSTDSKTQEDVSQWSISEDFPIAPRTEKGERSACREPRAGEPAVLGQLRRTAATAKSCGRALPLPPGADRPCPPPRPCRPTDITLTVSQIQFSADYDYWVRYSGDVQIIPGSDPFRECARSLARELRRGQTAPACACACAAGPVAAFCCLLAPRATRAAA